MSTHCSGMDTPVYAARVVEQFSDVRFRVLSACECELSAQKALTQVPGGHEHMFIDVLNMLGQEEMQKVGRVINESKQEDIYRDLVAIIMHSDLRPRAECRASSHRVNNKNGCARQIVDLDFTGSSCTTYSPQGKCILLIHLE